MRLSRMLPAAWVLAVLVLCGPGAGAEKPPAVPDPEPTAAQAAAVARHIRDLAAAEAKVRQAAREGLLSIGRPALKGLRVAAQSDDFEVSTAADELIEAIEKTPARPAPRPDPKPTPEQAAAIAGHIRDLGSEDPKVREAAKRGLMEIGRPALGALREASASSDAEVATSAKALIETIGKRATISVEREATRLTVTSRAETVVVDWAGGRIKLERTPDGGATETTEAESAEKFREKHPELWRDYVEPAMDETKQSRLLIQATYLAMRGELVKKLTAAMGRAPTDEELEASLKDFRAKLEEAYARQTPGQGGKPPPPRPDPAKGPQLVPLE